MSLDAVPLEPCNRPFDIGPNNVTQFLLGTVEWAIGVINGTPIFSATAPSEGLTLSGLESGLEARRNSDDFYADSDDKFYFR